MTANSPPKVPLRLRRVEEFLQQELTDLIRSRVRDPRLPLVTVTAVRASRDLRAARVFVITSDAAGNPCGRDGVQLLNGAAGFLRTQLAERNVLRFTPRLRFFYDDSRDRSLRVEQLLERCAAPSAH